MRVYGPDVALLVCQCKAEGIELAILDGYYIDVEDSAPSPCTPSEQHHVMPMCSPPELDARRMRAPRLMDVSN